MLDTTKSDRHDFRRLFAEALREARSAAVRKRAEQGYYPRSHHAYPTISWGNANGMPSLSTSTWNTPVDYGSAFSGHAKYDKDDFWSGPEYDPTEFPKYAALLAYIESNPKFKGYFTTPYAPHRIGKFEISHLIAQCVDRDLAHSGGVEIEDTPQLEMTISLATNAILNPILRVSAVVPLALTKFDVGHFQFYKGSYLFKMGEQTQLRRARIENHGSGASKSVVSAATHAFVSDPWTIRNENFHDLATILNGQNSPPYDLIDKFLASVRIVTGFETGYSQSLFAPRGWRTGYQGQIPNVYGTTIRKYPSRFDNYGWNRDDLPIVTRADLESVRTVFSSLIARQENKITLATKRLNACMTREDVEDAIVDATIGLEVLLGDDDPQSTAYKLRMRAAALVKVDTENANAASDIQRNITKIYKERSDIVHGNAGKRNKSKEIRTPNDKGSDIRTLAVDTLRTILKAMLRHPQYIDVAKIDRDLLIG